jgi:hypothetical protein
LTVAVGDGGVGAVLEVKSTKKDTFDEKGLRQLMDWQSQALMDTGEAHKGIFIGSNAVDKPLEHRPAGFADAWIKKAEKNNIIALKCEHLFKAWMADQEGKLDREAFWKGLLTSVGVYDEIPMMAHQETPQREKTDVAPSRGA